MVEQERAFDFWIGRWQIVQKMLQADGSWLELAAETAVSAILDGKALIEHWEGEVQFFWEGMTAPERMKGFSVRAYDGENGRWSIDWMDSRNPRFGESYVGVFENGRGEFYRETKTRDGNRLDRITFSDITPDAVHWELAVSNDGGESWTPIWIMEMSRISSG